MSDFQTTGVAHMTSTSTRRSKKEMGTLEQEIQAAILTARKRKCEVVIHFHDSAPRNFNANSCSLGNLGLMIVGPNRVQLFTYHAIRTVEVSRTLRTQKSRHQIAS
jgi:hypothetical protein